MIDVHVPGWPSDIVVRSFAACLAAELEMPLTDLPDPGERDLAPAISLWRGALAARVVGLVAIANADRFQWPGYWIAVLSGRDGATAATTLMFGATSGCVLSPADPALVGRAATDLPVLEGYVVAGFDPSERATAAATTAAVPGVVQSVAVAARVGAPMTVLPVATAIAGVGLAGDRYAERTGTFTADDPLVPGYHLTMIEAEAVEDLTLIGGVGLDPVDARRNIVTRGLDLDSLVGRRFRIGDEVVGLGSADANRARGWSTSRRRVSCGA